MLPNLGCSATGRFRTRGSTDSAVLRYLPHMPNTSRVCAVVGGAFVLALGALVPAGNAQGDERRDPTGSAPNGKIQKRFGPDSNAGKIAATLSAPVRVLPREATAAGAVTQIRVPNNAGCEGKTHWPHRSGNEASVHGTTTCAMAVQRLWVGTSLTRNRWWGEQTIANDTSSKSWTKTSKDATPHAWCLGEGTYTYTGWSDHTALIAGKTYVAGTRSVSKRFTC